jgi:hypothetical protein
VLKLAAIITVNASAPSFTNNAAKLLDCYAFAKPTSLFTVLCTATVVKELVARTSTE